MLEGTYYKVRGKPRGECEWYDLGVTKEPKTKLEELVREGWECPEIGFIIINNN